MTSLHGEAVVQDAGTDANVPNAVRPISAFLYANHRIDRVAVDNGYIGGHRTLSGAILETHAHARGET